jgi:hypothetical protein
VTGLNPSTTHYFAIKAIDEGGNVSSLSNVASVSTLGPDNTAPAAITNLAAAVGSGMGSVDLTWTAPGDDGMTGLARTYDLRYSTSAITEGNWASATVVPGLAAPKVAGSAEAYTVSGLSTGVTYYFAIKTSDEVPNTSGLSNVASARPVLGEVTLQDVLNGYDGTRDNYVASGAPTTNYGTYERMRATGYADQGDT